MVKLNHFLRGNRLSEDMELIHCDDPRFLRDLPLPVDPPLPAEPPLPEGLPPPDEPVTIKTELEEGAYSSEDLPDGALKLEATDEDTCMSDEEPTRDIMCRNFVRGTCQYSDTCKFAHKIILSQLPGVFTFCNDFHNTACTRPHCKFVHATVFEQEYFFRTGFLPEHAFAHIDRAPKPQATPTQAPRSQAPSLVATPSQAPQTQAPRSQAPLSQAPRSQAPRSQAPQSQAPLSQAPQSQAPRSQAPAQVGTSSFGPQPYKPSARDPRLHNRAAPPAPALPAPARPAPARPAPLQSAPLQPATLQTAPLQTAPLQPALLQTTPLQPAQQHHAPLQHAPLQPAPLQPAQQQHAPLQTAPLQHAPPRPAPLQPAPLQPAPLRTAPLQTAPLQTAPLQTAPLQTAPLQTAPLQTAPLQTAPLQTAPLQTAPLQTAPLQPAPLQLAPSTLVPPQFTTSLQTSLPHVTTAHVSDLGAGADYSSWPQVSVKSSNQLTGPIRARPRLAPSVSQGGGAAAHPTPDPGRITMNAGDRGASAALIAELLQPASKPWAYTPYPPVKPQKEEEPRTDAGTVVPRVSSPWENFVQFQIPDGPPGMIDYGTHLTRLNRKIAVMAERIRKLDILIRVIDCYKANWEFLTNIFYTILV